MSWGQPVMIGKRLRESDAAAAGGAAVVGGVVARGIGTDMPRRAQGRLDSTVSAHNRATAEMNRLAGKPGVSAARWKAAQLGQDVGRRARTLPGIVARGAKLKRAGTAVAAGGAALALGAGALHEIRRKDKPGWTPPAQEEYPFKGTTDMNELGRRARKARALGMGSHLGSTDNLETSVSGKP